jgi:hypothetical protein
MKDVSVEAMRFDEFYDLVFYYLDNVDTNTVEARICARLRPDLECVA